MVGGVCLHTGTIPSKTLREAILYLSGFRERTFYGKDYAVKREITVADLAFRVQKVMAKEIEVIRAQLARNHVDDRHGPARIHRSAHARGRHGATGPAVLTARAHPHRLRHAAGAQRDGAARRRADHRLGSAPRGQNASRGTSSSSGAGVIGLEYASMVTALEHQGHGHRGPARRSSTSSTAR